MNSEASRATSSFQKIYSRRFSDDSPRKSEWRRNLWGILVDDFFSRWIPRDSTVLDFGCGLGEFINAVEARHRIAVDLREDVVEHLDSSVEFIRFNDDWASRIGENNVTVAFCSNLLEHLPDRNAVILLFKDLHRILHPEGRLLILGPNLRYTGPAYWDFFDHILPFTHLSLVEALDICGFETERLIPRFLPYTAVGIQRKPLFLVRWYLRLPIAWKFWGAQFFAVAKPRKSQ